MIGSIGMPDVSTGYATAMGRQNMVQNQVDTVGRSKYSADGVQLSGYGSTKGTFAGSELSQMRGIVNIGMGLGNTTLDAISVQRNRLSKRINDVIKSAEITLGKNDKLNITVNKDNQFEVTGVADEKKRKALEKALNSRSFTRQINERLFCAEPNEY